MITELKLLFFMTLSATSVFSQVPTGMISVADGVQFLGQTLNIFSKDT